MAHGEPLILAIDQGTGSTKAMAVAADGTVVASATVAISQQHPQPGWVEQDPAEIWTSLRAAVRSCLTGDTAGRVDGVALSVQRESVLLWEDGTGRALTPVLSWQDERTRDRADRLAAHADHVRATTGLPLDPMFSALKAGWLLDRLDPERSRTASGAWRLGTLDAWLLAQFDPTDCVTEIGNASRTQLLDIRTGEWDGSMLTLFGVPAGALPRLVTSQGPFPAVRDVGPLPDGVPVVSVLGDSHAALFAQAGWRTGAVKATYGTGSSVMALGPASAAETGVCSTIAWDAGGRALALEANIRSAGRTLTWLADLFEVSVDVLVDEAERSNSDGATLVPAFGGLGAPWWDHEARPVVAGFTLGSRRAQLARAALESVAFQVDDVLRAFESADTPARTLVCDGGLTRSSALMQFQSDVSGVPVRRSATENLSALGAAYLGGITLGRWTRADIETWVDDEAEQARQAGNAFVPQSSTTARSTLRHGWAATVARSRLRPASQD